MPNPFTSAARRRRSAATLSFLSYTPIRWLLALAWTAWITIILIQPEANPWVDIGLRPAPPTLEREIVFTIGHVVAFVTMTALWWWAWVERLSFWRALVTAVIIALVFGGFTEWAQSFAPDRHPSLGDLLANVLGALLFSYRLVRRARLAEQRAA